MKYQNFAKLSSYLFFVVLFFSCSSKYGTINVCTIEGENGHYRIQSEELGIKGHQRIDLSSVWDKSAKFEFDALNSNCRDTGYVYLEIINNGDELIRAEETVEYYASIWAEDSGIGIDLKGLSYNYSSPLEIKEGFIIFPQSEHKNDDNLRNHFNSITKLQVIQAVKMYLSENESSSEEKQICLKCASEFKQNHSFGESQGAFSILDGIHQVVCTYKGKDGEYTKTIYYVEYHGC